MHSRNKQTSLLSDHYNIKQPLNLNNLHSFRLKSWIANWAAFHFLLTNLKNVGFLLILFPLNRKLDQQLNSVSFQINQQCNAGQKIYLHFQRETRSGNLLALYFSVALDMLLWMIPQSYVLFPVQVLVDYVCIVSYRKYFNLL